MSRPKYASDLEFPDDITKITASEVSKLHARYIGLQTYALAERAKIDVKILEIESERNRLTTQKRSQLFTSGNHKQWEQKAIIDSAVDKFEEKLLPLRQTQILIQSRIDIFEKYIIALSRDLTRRQHEKI